MQLEFYLAKYISNTKLFTILYRAIKSAIMVSLVIVFLVLATAFIIKIYSGQNIIKPYLDEFKNLVKSVKPSKKNKKKNTEEVDKKVQEPAINKQKATKRNNLSEKFSDVNKKVTEIQKIMENQGLTYDEAELYYNMNQSHYNA